MMNKSIEKTPDMPTAPAKLGNKAPVSRRRKMTKKARLISFLSKDCGVDVGSLSVCRHIKLDT